MEFWKTTGLVKMSAKMQEALRQESEEESDRGQLTVSSGPHTLVYVTSTHSISFKNAWAVIVCWELIL